MIWLRFLGILSWLKRMALSYPWQAALALCALWGLYQRHEAQHWQETADNCRKASEAAKKATAELRAKERQQYQEQADHAEQSHTARAATVRHAADAYVRSHRVRIVPDSSAAQPIGKADPASVSEGVSTGVVMGEADVRACADLYAYAVSAHDWAAEVGE